MSITRDFTDAAKDRLADQIRAAEAQDTNWFDVWIVDAVADWFISGDIASYNNDIVEFQAAIVDKKDTTIEKLNSIFDAVYSVESTYSTRFRNHKDMLPDIAKAFANIAEILNPTPADGGSFQLLRTSSELTSALNQSTQHILAGILDGMIKGYSEDGTPIYNWDEIARVLDKDASDITGFEYYVLASLFAQMDTPDMELFLSHLADHVADEKGAWHIPQHPTEYSKWEYSEDKVRNIQAYLDASANSMFVQNQYLDSLDNDALLTLLQEKYPERDFSQVDVGKYKEELMRELVNNAADLSQRSALLSVMANLDSFADRESPFGTYTFEFPGLNGLPGADGPKISLVKDENSSYSLTFHNSVSLTTGENNFIHNMNVNVIEISRTVTGKGAVRLANQNTTQYFEGLFNYSIGNGIVEEGVSLVGDQISGKVLETLGESIFKQGSKLIGLIPIVGDIASAGIDILNDYNENQKNITESTRILGVLGDAEICNWFNLHANFVYPGDPDKTLTIISPGATTNSILERFNEAIANHNIDLSANSSFDYPITYQDILNNSEEVCVIIDTLPMGIVQEVFY